MAELRVRVPDGAADTVLIRYGRDGEARLAEAAAVEQRDGETWWQVEIPLRNPVVWYRWLLAGGSVGYGWLNGRGVHAHEVPPFDDFAITAEPVGPAWHPRSIVYEIFIDRFASSGAVRDLPLWSIPRDWSLPPDRQSNHPHRELYGGDLRGVEDHLDHVVALGANAIWLTPFFAAESNHRFAASSFDHVDPLLGGDEALDSLIQAAHRRGIRLIADLSLDHCGTRHDWFLRATADPASVERAFFYFDRSETNGYASWLGYKEMPRLDWRSDELRRRMGEMLRRWVATGLDGWRIDAASTIGRYRDLDLNREIAHWARGHLGETLSVAEYWHDFRPDLDGCGWHGVTNYAGFMRPVWWWLRDEAHTADLFDVFSGAPAPSYGGQDVASVFESFHAGVPWEASLQSWLLLDSHDTPRFGRVCGSRARTIVGIGLQMTMPGVPVIFAGDELGLDGQSGYDARRAMPWDTPDSWDPALLGCYRELVALRRSSDVFARGGLRFVHVQDDAVVYLRETQSERVLCLAARAPHRPVSVPFAQLERLYGDEAEGGVLPAGGPAFHVWRVHE
jgi:alpha-glucosidase